MKETNSMMIGRRKFVAAAAAIISTAGSRPVLAAGEYAASVQLDDDEKFAISMDDYRKVKPQFRATTVDYDGPEPAGTIVVDTGRYYLYLVQENGKARRYGIGVGRQGFEWSGDAVIRRKAKWPRWTPPKSMVARDPEAAKWAGGMPGGPDNPLGARALYLYQGKVDTLYRIHGTGEPASIGRAVSSGCIRLLNADVVDLYERVPIGTRVIVRPHGEAVAASAPEERVGPERKRRTLLDFLGLAARDR
jgi:lipoprotein-anchoring transpeptidase ErfK/SrfK